MSEMEPVVSETEKPVVEPKSCGGKGAPVAGCPCQFCRRVAGL